MTTDCIELAVFSNGEICTVLLSPEDSDLLKYNWFINKDGYAVRYQIFNGERKIISLHRTIISRFDSREYLVCDHDDTNKLNNQRENLRRATPQENQFNRGMNKNNTSGQKGVSREGNKWVARIRHNRIKIYLGSFSDIDDAAAAYNKREKELFGEFCRKNQNK